MSDSIIAIENLTKEYKGKGKQCVHAVKNVSLTVEKGDVFGILGASGAGKSTLLKCVNLLEKPTSGRVLLNGVSLSDLSEKELNLQRRKIGMIFQHFNLFSQCSVCENVAFPLKIAGVSRKEAKRRALVQLGYAGLADKADCYPSELSGGQKQRAAIARALVNEPEILLCDEATSALDSVTSLNILNLLKKINAELGLTILLITHELGVVKHICNKVAVMEDGRIAEQGTAAEILSNPSSDAAKKLVLSGGVK